MISVCMLGGPGGGDGQQLDMSKAHLGHVRDQQVADRVVIQKLARAPAAPAAQVQFVDRNRRSGILAGGALAAPFAVLPGMARQAGNPTPTFRYRDFGNLATNGRMAAVVDLHGFKISGLLAWWFWLAAHVFFLIGFRNRLIVLLNWAWSYWSYQRHARIILGRDPPRAVVSPRE